MRILVTGGAGYVGAVSVEALLAAGHDVVVLDDLSTGHRTAVAGGARLVTGSYADESETAALMEVERIEAVLHCAARSLVGESVAQPAHYYRENVAGGLALLEACPSGTLVFWDRETGPAWHGVTPADLKALGYLHLRSETYILEGRFFKTPRLGHGGVRTQEMHLFYKE